MLYHLPLLDEHMIKFKIVSLQLMWRQCTMATVCFPMVRTAWPRRLLGSMPVSIIPQCPLAWCQHLLHPVLLHLPAPHPHWILQPQSHQSLLQFLSQWQLLPLPPIRVPQALLPPGLHGTFISALRYCLSPAEKFLYVCIYFHFFSSRPQQTTIALPATAAAPVAAPVAAIIPPPPDIQPVIDKLAEYVARNGVKFETSVRAKNDPR